MNTDNKRISFSEVKTWKECPFKHKLVYIEKLPHFSGNEYTAFGTALHLVCEKKIMDEAQNAESIFLSSFEEELALLEEPANPSLVAEMKVQASNLFEHILPEVKRHFGEYEVFSVEEKLFEKIEEFDSFGKSFKGFIDLVLKTPDGLYHVIDWKTCSWGWNERRKSDPLTNYQLTYYKHFFSKKHSVDLDKIKTHFILLKRTATKNLVEVVSTTSGSKKMKNSLNLLEKAVININNNNFIKNRLSCRYCKFYKTEHCP